MALFLQDSRQDFPLTGKGLKARPFLKAPLCIKALALCLVGLFVLGGCTERPVGSKERPFSMFFVPSIDATKVSVTADALAEYLSKSVSQKIYGKDTGFYVKASVPASYIAVVEAFGTKKADFAAFNTFSYILAKDIKKYDVEAVLTLVRHDGTKTYKSQIITHVDSGIDSLSDLSGKKFAFSDPASTSGYFLPSKLLADKGIKLGEAVFANKHDNVVTMVYQKQVDAGATFYSPPREVEEGGKKVEKLMDARARVITQFPDVAKKVKIIAFSSEIPNEPWVIRSKLYEDEAKNKAVKTAIVEALIEFSETEYGKKVLKDLYDLKALVSVSDEDYKEIRQLVSKSNLNLEKLVSEKK